uniref:Uncharacterized protein n=1 Tax=Triticum urartu TaxID=4572 RepID=A0A8R7R3N8_TRIUA
TKKIPSAPAGTRPPDSAPPTGDRSPPTRATPVISLQPACPSFLSVLLLLSWPPRACLDPWPLLKPSSGHGHDWLHNSRPPSHAPSPASPSPRLCSTVAVRRQRHQLQPRSNPPARHGQRPWRTHLRLLTRCWPANTSTNFSSI